jgi:spore coat protein U-like protein
MKKILSLVSLIILGLVFSGLTYAGQATGTLQVSANTVGVCTVSTIPVNFGTTDGSALVYANGDVTVNCPVDTTYHIALDAGAHRGGTFREVSDYTLNYSVPYSLSRTTEPSDEWGDVCGSGTYNAVCVDDTGNGSNQAHTVYGRLGTFALIPGGTALTDTVTVTVYY